MQYFVSGNDGSEYGPADVQTLRAWALENRIQPDTMMRDAQSGALVTAGAIPGIFDAGPAPATPYGTPPVGTPYQNPYPSYNAGAVKQDNGPLYSVIFWCALSLVIFFFLRGFGMLMAGITLVQAIQARAQGYRSGNVSVAIALTTCIIIGIGWFLRSQGAV